MAQDTRHHKSSKKKSSHKRKKFSHKKKNYASDSEDEDDRKERYIKKLHSYIKKGRLKKLDKIISIFSAHAHWRHSLNEVINVRLKDECSYLHKFSSEGNSIMLNVILDLDADVGICDEYQNNFLHVAFDYILKTYDRNFLTFIVDQIFERVDSTLLEDRNNYGETPVDLLEEVMANLNDKHAYQFVEIENESEIFSNDEISWNEKLFFEMGQEENEERFQQEEFEDTYRKTNESFKDWGDRIWNEYNRKRNSALSQSSGQKRRRAEKNPRDHSFKNKKSKPVEHLKELKENFFLLERREKYEEACHRLFKESNSCKVLLGMSDLPWSHFPEFQQVKTTLNEQLLFDSMLQSFLFGFSDDEKMKYLKVQRIRWHPDKFQQKCASRLLPDEKVRICELVIGLSQTINAHLTSMQKKE